MYFQIFIVKSYGINFDFILYTGIISKVALSMTACFPTASEWSRLCQDTKMDSILSAEWKILNVMHSGRTSLRKIVH